MFFRKKFVYLVLALLLAGCSLITPPPTLAPVPTYLAPTLTVSVPAKAPTLATQSSSTPFPSATVEPSRTPFPSTTVEPSLTPTITPTLPPAAAIVRGPYLQDVAPGSIWVAWDTDQASTGWVRFGAAPAMEQVAIESQSGTHHAVKLAGLADDTQYFYQVGGDESPASFLSAPAPGAEKFSFAVLGDTRANPDVHAAIIQRIAGSHPGLVLHTGDLVDDGSIAWEWDAFLKIEAPMMRTAPLYPTLGNHEGASPLYFQIFHLPGNGQPGNGEPRNGEWYAFDYADARFIVLRADSYAPANFAPGREQRAWLESQLASATGKWIFVSFHVPLHTSFSEDPSEVNLRNALAPLFEKYGVTAVFSGHIHSYERVLANGVTYIVTGGGGAPLYPLAVREPGQQAASLSYHYMLFTADGDTLAGQAIDVNGKVIDSFTLTPRR